MAHRTRRRTEPPIEQRACWLCGIVAPTCRQDLFFSPRPLCGDCRSASPSARSKHSRAISAARCVLGQERPLPPNGQWRGMVELIVRRTGLASFADTTAPAPGDAHEIRFGYLDPDVLARARQMLAELGAEHERTGAAARARS